MNDEAGKSPYPELVADGLTPLRGLLPDGAKSYAKPIKRAFRGP